MQKRLAKPRVISKHLVAKYSVMYLDCETSELAERSLACILQINKNQLYNRLHALRHDDFPVNTCIVSDRWKPMVNAIAGQQMLDIEIGNTSWFHASRVSKFASFRQGIRPLQFQYDKTWDWLYTLVADKITLKEWSVFRRQTVKDNYGGHSKEVISSWMSAKGPYAFLIAESPLKPRDTGNHDYLETSELVEFISICFERKFCISLKDIYKSATQPVLVKFKTSGIKVAYLGSALDYLLHRMNGWSLSSIDHVFSGGGQAITTDQMVKVIPILEMTRRLGETVCYHLSPENDHVSLLVD